MTMGGGSFSPEEIEYLRSLPAVAEATSTRIIYAEEFKQHCVRELRRGNSPVRIFREAGLDPALIGYKRIERSVARWRRTIDVDGEGAGEGMSEGTGVFEPDDTIVGTPDDHSVERPQSAEIHKRDSQFSGPAVALSHLRGSKERETGYDMRDLVIYQQARHIDTLEHHVESLERHIVTLQDRENQLQSHIDTLESHVESMRQHIVELESLVDYLRSQHADADGRDTRQPRQIEQAEQGERRDGVTGAGLD